MKNYLLLLLALASTPSLSAQTGFFETYQLNKSDTDRYERRAFATDAALFTVATPDDLLAHLWSAPAEGSEKSSPTLLELPTPDGRTVTFELTRYRMISPRLQAHFPDLLTAYGTSPDQPGYTVFLDFTGHGFHASVRGPAAGPYYVEPLFRGSDRHYQVYRHDDFLRAADNDYRCVLEENLDDLANGGPATAKSVGDCRLREYDLALACTGEYYNYHGTTDQEVFDEMVTAMNRVNEVTRLDLAITQVIINPVAGNGDIALLYDDPATDPYTNNSGSAMLGENQTTIDAVVGSANYDIGHVFSTGGGGVASLDSPCNDFRKARGVTGLRDPIGDPFYIDYVAHEMGHQFGGTHTFNDTTSSCSQRTAMTAYEPGGGTTIQAYAGICRVQSNIQENSDAYYHAASIQQISEYMENGRGDDCADYISTANTAPAITPGQDYTIPLNTPFVLTATATDANGDILSYCWEQFDLGMEVEGEPTGTEPDGPLFRSRPPEFSAERYFPALPDLVAGTSNWESLPLVERDLNFIVTVRDINNLGYGCTVQDEVTVTAVATGGQYEVLFPNGGESLRAGTTSTITWNTADTENAPVNCGMVDILLSTDGGITFPDLIATTANDGSYDWNLPNMVMEDLRLMIRCNGNIFFDISDADFIIIVPDYEVDVLSGTASICEGESAPEDYRFSLASIGGYTGNITYSVPTPPNGTTVGFDPATVALADGDLTTVLLTLSNTEGLAPGSYDFDVNITDGVTTRTETFTLVVGQSDLDVQSPVDGAIVPHQNGPAGENDVTFTWTGVDGGSVYIIRYEGFRDGNLFLTGSTGLNFGSSTGMATLTQDFEFSTSFMAGDSVSWFMEANDALTSTSCTKGFVFSLAFPVEWLSFSARPVGKTAELDWSVIQDAAHAGFTVERASDGSNRWADVGHLPRAGVDGTADYTFTDRTVESGNTYLYRLRQEDLDGTQDYSVIRTVTLGTARGGLTVYPNPTTGQLWVRGADAGAAFSIYDGLGRELRSGLLQAGATPVDLAGFSAGVYQLRVGDAVRKVVVR